MLKRRTAALVWQGNSSNFVIPSMTLECSNLGHLMCVVRLNRAILQAIACCQQSLARAQGHAEEESWSAMSIRNSVLLYTTVDMLCMHIQEYLQCNIDFFLCSSPSLHSCTSSLLPGQSCIAISVLQAHVTSG